VTKRIISTIALWAILYLIIHFFGVFGGVCILALFAAATQWELYTLLEKMGFPVNKKTGTLLGICILLVPYLLGYFEVKQETDSIKHHMMAFAVILLSLNVISRDESKRITQFKTLMPTLFGVFYIPFLMSFFILINEIAVEMVPERKHLGILLIIWVIAVSKFSDVGALIVGKMIGKNKLAPTLSPGKTIEGAVGGVIVSSLVSGFYIYFIQATDIFPIYTAVLLAIPIAITAIIGDLIESTFKRCANSKDSGNLIPGIGGAYDLADSLILTGPLGYLLIEYFVL
jgi:phosphatidate cytidylyltransferase